MRYHIVSLVAVFLALGLGILIGTIMVQDPDVLEAQDSLIKQLSDDLKRLDAQNAQDRERLEAVRALHDELESWANEMFPLLVSNRLFGRQIALVCLDGAETSEETAAIRETLSAAGALTRVVTFLRPVSDLLVWLEDYSFGIDSSPNRNSDTSKAALVLAYSVVAGYDSVLSGQLVEAGLLEIDGPSDSSRIDSVVVVSGPNSAVLPVKTLVDALGEYTVLLVGSAFRESEFKPTSEKADSSVTVMDGPKTIPQRYKLVMSLAGGERRLGSR